MSEKQGTNRAVLENLVAGALVGGLAIAALALPDSAEAATKAPATSGDLTQDPGVQEFSLYLAYDAYWDFYLQLGDPGPKCW